MAVSLHEAAGSLLVVGLSGMEPTAAERVWLKELRPAGIILFRRNIADAKQTRALLRNATALCSGSAARFVDVEGGTVDRLRDVLAPMPSAQAVATAARIARDATLARRHGELVARAVKAFGFNTTLAPVLDLGLPESAGVMGSRCAGATAAEVIDYVRGFLAGLAAHDVVGCGKHFPGLGGGTLDSHKETPAIERTWKQLWNEDLVPYRTVRSKLPMVMVSHGRYPLTREKKRPASVSKFWIDGVLRERIDYRGIALSDDMEMGGVLNAMPMEEAAVEAVRAGTELIEICHQPELILRAYEALVREGERSKAFAAVLVRQARQSTRKREKIYAERTAAALSARQFAALRDEILRFTEVISKASDSHGSRSQ